MRKSTATRRQLKPSPAGASHLRPARTSSFNPTAAFLRLRVPLVVHSYVYTLRHDGREDARFGRQRGCDVQELRRCSQGGPRSLLGECDTPTVTYHGIDRRGFALSAASVRSCGRVKDGVIGRSHAARRMQWVASLCHLSCAWWAAAVVAFDTGVTSKWSLRAPSRARFEEPRGRTPVITRGRFVSYPSSFMGAWTSCCSAAK